MNLILTTDPNDPDCGEDFIGIVNPRDMTKVIEWMQTKGKTTEMDLSPPMPGVPSAVCCVETKTGREYDLYWVPYLSAEKLTQ